MPANFVKDTLSSPYQLTIRYSCLVFILGIELYWLTSRYQVPSIFLPRISFATDATWSMWLLYYSKHIWPLCIWMASICLLTLILRSRQVFSELLEYSHGHPWPIWLAFHLLALALFAFLTSLMFARPTDPARLSSTWFIAWLALASSTALLWSLALAPGRFWLQLMRQERLELIMGCLLGILAWLAIRPEGPLAQEDFWRQLAKPTLSLVYWLLGLIYSDLTYQPEEYLIGTDLFQAEIFYVCSGYEGITLICIFLAIYCWLFRKELRFPQAFWLFPLGALAIWLANSVRIAMLIVIGTQLSPEIASKGFHSQAGWIAFTLIALAAIVISHQMHFFTVSNTTSSVHRHRHSPPLANALLVPLLVLIGGSMLTAAVSTGFELLYPVRATAAAAFLFYYRTSYRGLGWKGSWQAVVIGFAVFVMWILMEPGADDGQTALARGLGQLSPWSAHMWLVFRVIGAVVVIPLVEELAFRGYLLRKLSAADFESVDFKQFSWISLLASSVCFGLLHERWFAGTLAGMVYGLAWYRRGQIADAVLAHMTTNGLIALLVLTQGRWSLWS